VGILVPISLFGWVFVAMALFTLMPPRRAALVSYIAAWLFLPVSAIELPGIPDLTKITATSLGAIAGVVLFDAKRLSAFRFSWVDMPAVVWCTSTMVSSLTNGYGAYDGFSGILQQLFTWGIPYFIGRLYFSDLAGLRELAVGVFIGGLVYVPLCLLELRLSPQLHNWVYGFHPTHFAMTVRYGGYRPMVFMQHGLMLGMWMTSASLVGVWLWHTGAIKRMFNLPMSWLAMGQLVVTVMCKSSGAIALLIIGLGVLFSTRVIKSSIVVIALVLIPPLYMWVRTEQWWQGEEIVEFAKNLGPERADSVLGRFENENLLTAHALEKRWFGWGGWDAWRVKDPDTGEDITVADGMWVITFGEGGLVALIAVTVMVLLPILLLARRVPVRNWVYPAVAGPAALAVLLILYLIDNLLNAMLNPVYMIAAGGLSGF